MKVGDITPYTRKGHGPGRCARESQQAGFEQVLNRALQPSGPEMTPSPTGAQALPGTIASANAVGPAEGKAGIAVMERFIDALEGYRKRLADPRCPLRDIAPAIERLEAAHQHLSRFAAQGTVEKPLSDLMNEGLVTAAMEIRRFHSGVYC